MSVYLIVSTVPGTTLQIVRFRVVMAPNTYGGGGS